MPASYYFSRNRKPTDYSGTLTQATVVHSVTYDSGDGLSNNSTFTRKVIETAVSNNQIADLSPLCGFTSLTWLDLQHNQIIDIQPISGFTLLTWLDLEGNQIGDIEPLVSNPGMAPQDLLNLRGNPLSSGSVNTCIPALQARGVEVPWGNLDS